MHNTTLRYRSKNLLSGLNLNIIVNTPTKECFRVTDFGATLQIQFEI
jgi:hypothetical protein